MKGALMILGLFAQVCVSAISSQMDKSKQWDVISSVSIPGLGQRRSWFAWPDIMDKDSLVQCLQTAVIQFSQSEGSFSDRIAEGICWHLLYRTGLDSGLTKANRIISSISVLYPSSPETAWLNGINCIWSGKIKKGLSILDSLRATTYQNDTAFLRDYLQIAQKCFLPINDLKDDSASLSGLLQKKNITYIGPDDIIPRQVDWGLHERMWEKFTMSRFSLSAVFGLVPSPTLQMPPLMQNTKPLLNVVIDSQIAARIPSTPVIDPFSNKAKMEMRIIAIPGFPQSSLADYLCTFVCNQYDEVKEMSDLIKFRAVAVRCRNRSCFRNVAGDYYAYVAFDAQVTSEHGQLRIEPTAYLTKKGSVGVRYLIAMRSCETVENKAEQIFQNVLAKFETVCN